MSGFNGGSLHKNEYNFSRRALLLASRSFNMGTSQVNSSQAMFGYLNLVRSSMSGDGSSHVRVTSSSSMAGLVRLQTEW